MAQTNNDEWVIIDGTKSQENVAKDVDQAIMTGFNFHRKRMK